MSIFKEFCDMLNKETDSDMIDAIWKWDFDKIREIRIRNRKKEEIDDDGGESRYLEAMDRADREFQTEW